MLTSSSSAVGAAKPGETVDEDHPFTIGRLGIAYINSKHDAELVAMRIGGKGAARRDRQSLVRPRPRRPEPERHLECPRPPPSSPRIPGYLDGAINIVDVRDVARGHVLADERGEDGERYLLTGRNFTLQRLFADLSRIAGRAAPAAPDAGRLAVAGVEAMELIGLPTPTSPDEVRSGTQWFTYRNDKAREQLGWEPRPHEETLEDTVALAARRSSGSASRATELTDCGASTTGARRPPASLR